MKYRIRNFVLIAFTLILFVMAGCQSGKKEIEVTPIDEHYITGNIVESIDFVSNKTFKDKKLKKELDFKVGDKFDSILIESGKYAVSEFYRKKGFTEVQISIDTDEFKNGRIVYIVEEGARFAIKSVKFVGNKIIKTGDLRSTVKIKTNNWIFWPVYYTKEKIDADIKRLETVYLDRGFLNYDIQALGRSNITFLVDEGAQFSIRELTLNGNKHFDTNVLMSDLELEPGEIFYPKKAQAHSERMRKLYRENGFVDVKVLEEFKFAGEDGNQVDLEFTIVEGNQFRIGRIDITGNGQTQDRVIRRVLDEYGFSPGQLYNANLAPVQGGGQLERRVQNATLAEEVSIMPVTAEADVNNRLDARINISEGLTGMWNPGVTYGSDNGLTGQLKWSQRNFDITDWPESFSEFITMQSFKGAGQHLQIELMPGVEVSTYRITFKEPYYKDKPVSLSASGSSWERWYQSHDEKRETLSFGFTNRYRNMWRTSIGFRAENIEVKNIDFDAPMEIREYKGNNLLLGTKLGIEKDTRDDIYLPSRGYNFNLNYEQITGDDDFGILESSSIFYRTLYEDFQGRKTILATKLLAGTTFSNAPFYEKFYAGGIGEYGIRGFEYRGVSTRGLQTNVANPYYKDPIGSDWIFLANTELTVPFVGENVSLLFFLDSGTIDTGPYRASIGGGIQIMVPQFFGPIPIRFTLADALKKDDDDETQSFNFSMGGMFPY